MIPIVTKVHNISKVISEKTNIGKVIYVGGDHVIINSQNQELLVKNLTLPLGINVLINQNGDFIHIVPISHEHDLSPLNIDVDLECIENNKKIHLRIFENGSEYGIINDNVIESNIGIFTVLTDNNLSGIIKFDIINNKLNDIKIIESIIEQLTDYHQSTMIPGNTVIQNLHSSGLFLYQVVNILCAQYNIQTINSKILKILKKNNTELKLIPITYKNHLFHVRLSYENKRFRLTLIVPMIGNLIIDIFYLKDNKQTRLNFIFKSTKPLPVNLQSLLTQNLRKLAERFFIIEDIIFTSIKASDISNYSITTTV